MRNDNLESSYIFVDSTLPSNFLKKQKTIIKESKIFCKKLSVYKSLKYIFPKKKILFIENFFFIRLLYIFIKAKINKNNIVFFHECCNPIFDILINFFKLKGFYLPITDPLKIVNPLKKDLYKIKELNIFKKFFYFFFERLILTYFYVWIRSNKFYFVFKKYHKKIKKKKIEQFRKNINHSINKNKKNKILLFLSKVPSVNNVDYNQSLNENFYKIIKFCISNKIKIYAKDHPQESQRCRLKHKNLKNINPLIPSELINYNSYDFYISLTSNSLCSFGGKAISIVNLISRKKKVIKFYKQTYKNRNFSQILYPKNMKDLERIILKN